MLSWANKGNSGLGCVNAVNFETGEGLDDCFPIVREKAPKEGGRMERAEQGKYLPSSCAKSDAAVAMLKVEMKEHTQITTKVFFHETDVV